MKPELLETLLLDRALGELTPEVAALLDAHLAQAPDAARRAAEIGATLQLARSAVAVPSVAPRRALDVNRLRSAESQMKSAARRTEILRLAACLALGLGLGWLARTPQPPAAAIPSWTNLTLASSPAAGTHPGFWSRARLAADQTASTGTAARRQNRYELNWKSTANYPVWKENHEN